MKRKITLQNTDATGSIYFTLQFQFALEAFEEFLSGSGLGLALLFSDKNYLMPIVHAESDYLAPLKVGDEIVVENFLDSLGVKSFSIGFLIKKGECVVGKGKIVHAVIDKTSGLPVAIPKQLQDILQGLVANA